MLFLRSKKTIHFAAYFAQGWYIYMYSNRFEKSTIKHRHLAKRRQFSFNGMVSIIVNFRLPPLATKKNIWSLSILTLDLSKVTQFLVWTHGQIFFLKPSYSRNLWSNPHIIIKQERVTLHQKYSLINLHIWIHRIFFL